MGLKEIKGDWREDDLAVLAMPPEREKSLYQLKNKADNNNRGQRGQSRGNGRNEGEREKRKKPRTNDTASIRASYSSRLTSQHPYFGEGPRKEAVSFSGKSPKSLTSHHLYLGLKNDF